MSSLGYFAFPPPVDVGIPTSGGSNHVASYDRHPEVDVAARHATEARQRAQDHMRDEQRRAQEERRQRRAEVERELMLQGEMEYVRMGLSIRNRFGRVDKTRTDFVRAEIRKRDALTRITKQWESYERRWRGLMTSGQPITFATIPWPIPVSPSSVDDLDPDLVVQFFLESLQVPRNTASETDRLRSALLRWHPDKMSNVFSQTVDSELDSVRDGVNVIFRALHARIHHVKGSHHLDPRL
ncbi:hypothetical protein C8Q79DRAFT_667598 [Trametes meyenii]|nr:hypothetical protein C8Q79DRAFT_667598 [Trametes meyenii]